MTKLLFVGAHAVPAVFGVPQAFLDKLAEGRRRPLVAGIVWLVRVATAREIPVIAMAEDCGHIGIRLVRRYRRDDLVL